MAIIDGYIEMRARRATMASCGCGTLVIGEAIGYNPKTGRTRCSGCMALERHQRVMAYLDN